MHSSKQRQVARDTDQTLTLHSHRRPQHRHPHHLNRHSVAGLVHLTNTIAVAIEQKRSGGAVERKRGVGDEPLRSQQFHTGKRSINPAFCPTDAGTLDQSRHHRASAELRVVVRILTHQTHHVLQSSNSHHTQLPVPVEASGLCRVQAHSISGFLSELHYSSDIRLGKAE